MLTVEERGRNMSNTLKGAAATAHMEQIFQDNERIRNEELAEHKTAALQCGKELFDLDEFGKFIDVVWRCEYGDYPIAVSRERKIEHYEYSYYVMYPSVMTLKEFAVKVEELRRWDLE